MFLFNRQNQYSLFVTQKQIVPFLFRFAVTISLISLSAFLAYKASSAEGVGIDDGHIFLVYGRNLADGFGPVYYPSAERVEGFSSILWVSIVALSYMFFSVPDWWLVAISILLTSASVAFLWLYLDDGEKVSWRGLLLIVWVLFAPLFVLWTSLSLMEIALWSALLISTTVLCLRFQSPSWLISILIVLIVLTRPEGMLWAPVFITTYFIIQAVDKNHQAALRKIFAPTVGLIITLVFLTIFRLVVFGYPLPNTYYAKMDPNILRRLTQGVYYMLRFLSEVSPMIIVFAIATTALIINFRWLGQKIRSRKILSEEMPRLNYIIISSIVLFGLFVPILEGGDHFGFFRFYQPIWPLLIVPVVMFIDNVKLGESRFVHLLSPIIALSLLLFPNISWFNGEYKTSLKSSFNIAEEGEAIGKLLNEFFRGTLPSVGVITIGGIASTYKGPIIDLVGLTNSEMAHANSERYGMIDHDAFSPDVFYNQSPNLLLPFPGPIEEFSTVYHDLYINFSNVVLKGLITSESFKQKYQLITISTSDKQVHSWTNKEYIKKLKESGYHINVIQDDFS